MDIDPALTKQQVEALNTVDLRLLGVTHGIIKGSRVDGIKDTDYQKAKEAVDRMRAARGDVLAIEPTGFVSLDEPPTISSILPIKLPNGTEGSELSDELKVDLAELIEKGRKALRINNLAYVAIHALLKDIPVHTAEITMDEWQNLQARLKAQSGDAAIKKEEELFYRNGRMLARLGNIAIGMTRKPRLKNDSTLLYISGSAHTPRLGNRLEQSGVSFTANW